MSGFYPPGWSGPEDMRAWRLKVAAETDGARIVEPTTACTGTGPVVEFCAVPADTLAALEAVARAAEEAYAAWEAADRDASERPAMEALDAALRALKEARRA